MDYNWCTITDLGLSECLPLVSMLISCYWLAKAFTRIFPWTRPTDCGAVECNGWYTCFIKIVKYLNIISMLGVWTWHNLLCRLFTNVMLCADISHKILLTRSSSQTWLIITWEMFFIIVRCMVLKNLVLNSHCWWTSQRRGRKRKSKSGSH